MVSTVAIAASTATSHARTTTIGCALSHAEIDACSTTLTAWIDGRLRLVGHGTAKADGGAHRVAVSNHLSGVALRMADRPGGLEVRVHAKIRAAGVRAILHATATTRLVLPKMLVVPSDGMFASKSSVIQASSLAYLRDLRSKLAGVKRLHCVGFTDALGPVAYSLALGHARAQADCRFLTHGWHISSAASSQGEANPRATNNTLAGRALNRRVEVRIYY